MRDVSKITILALIILLAVPVAATAGTRIEKQLDLSSGGTFRLDTDAGSVSVVGASSSGAEVSGKGYDVSPSDSDTRASRKSETRCAGARKPPPASSQARASRRRCNRKPSRGS